MNKKAVVSKGRSAREVYGAVTLAHVAQHLIEITSILNPNIMTDLNLNYTQLGLITGVSSFMTVPFQMVYSIITRYVYRNLLLGIGNILSSLSCFLTGLANSFQGLLGSRIVSNIGNAGHNSIATSILSDKYGKMNISGALSSHWGLSYIPYIVGPIVLSSMTVLWEWRRALTFYGIIPFVVGLLVMLYLRGETSVSKLVKTGEDSSLWSDAKSAIHLRGAILIIVASVFIFGGPSMNVIMTYLPLFLNRGLGIGIFESSIVYSISMAGGVLGTIVFGQLANRFGSLKILIAVIGSSTILDLLLVLHNSFSILLIIHLFMIGVASFSCVSLLQAHLATIAPTPRQRDIIIGLLFTFSSVLSPVHSTLTGLLIDTYQSFNSAWILKSAFGAVALCLLLLDSHGRKQKRTSSSSVNQSRNQCS